MARGGMEGPVNFSWTQAVLAGATFNPFDNWDYETPDTDVAVEVLTDATAVGMILVLKSGGMAISQESPVKAGGVAGVLPARQTTEPLTGRGFASKKLQASYRNPTGGTITVNGSVSATPIPGGRGGFAGGGGARRPPPRRRRR